MPNFGRMSEVAWLSHLGRVAGGILGVVAITAAQVHYKTVDAQFFSLFFWCVVTTRFFGGVAAAATIAAATVLGNICFLHPRGEFSLAGHAGYLSALFVGLAAMCAQMVISIKKHVAEQQQLLAQAERSAQDNRALADALGRAVTARDTFLAVAGHELKSPVTGLMLQSQVWQRRLAKRTISQDELRTVWERQAQALARLATLIDELLDVSRINGGQLQLNLDEMDLSQLAQEVVGRYSQPAAEANCTLTTEIEPNVVGQWDRVRLEQVMTNLLSNAVKYGAGKPVHLRVGARGGVAHLTVRDHGKGIDAADRERIFECFERVSVQSHVDGLGLGLWIVRQIVDAAGGQVRVDSEAGAGAKFTVNLPQQRHAPGGLPPAAHERAQVQTRPS